MVAQTVKKILIMGFFVTLGAPNVFGVLNSTSSSPSEKTILKVEDKDKGITRLDLRRYPLLEVLDISDCRNLKVLENISKCPLLGSINANNSAIEKLDLNVCQKLSTLFVKNCYRLKELTVSKCANLRSLEAPETGLTALDLSGCSALEELKVYKSKNFNRLTLPTQGRYLTKIDASETWIATLNLSGCPALRTFDVFKCWELTELKGLSACKSLREIIVNETAITELDLSFCSGMVHTLQASGCTLLKELKGFNKPHCINLETVRVANTNLQSLDFSGCSNLKFLDAARCPELTNIDASRSVHLKLDVTGCPKLTKENITADYTCKITGLEEKPTTSNSGSGFWGILDYLLSIAL